MCLTTDALVLFLSLLPAEIISSEPERIIVHAEIGNTVWKHDNDIWCTD